MASVIFRAIFGIMVAFCIGGDVLRHVKIGHCVRPLNYSVFSNGVLVKMWHYMKPGDVGDIGER